MDILSVGGLVLAFSMFIAAFFMEGGTLGALLQPTSAMIVFGGTQFIEVRKRHMYRESENRERIY